MVHSLTKDDDAADLDGVSKLIVGISWDKSNQQSKGLMGRAKKQMGMDLDLVAVIMQGSDPIRYAGMKDEADDPMKDGSVIHTGDNTTGEGEGDDEQVICDLTRVKSNVTAIVFVAGALKKRTKLAGADNVSFTVYDASDGVPGPVAEIMPSLLSTNGNACAVAKAFRANSDSPWQFKVLNEMGKVSQGDFQSLLRFAVGK